MPDSTDIPLGVTMIKDLRSAHRGLYLGKSKYVCGNKYNHCLLYMSRNTCNKSRGLAVERAAQSKDAQETMILEGDFYIVPFLLPGFIPSLRPWKFGLQRTSKPFSPKITYNGRETARPQRKELCGAAATNSQPPGLLLPCFVISSFVCLLVWFFNLCLASSHKKFEITQKYIRGK